ncbi:DUF1524 domain-containing protein [endosymbiont GvMRE of Glomus versiforme]|uniref:DUF1524 domain-containing protein n=1 Tax=endosymbiont GvMRE of Glomus versiforme TaxID=2039283 RepID=UPI000EC4C9AC|nr:DUF1524 domain-containing protein [endosymbiont GvMRE of Glomus versiforme]RHZ35693.1 hypothetical protein GvMRE_IIg441 [endosymbiont GvMRE of Glomus versiforme]
MVNKTKSIKLSEENLYRLFRYKIEEKNRQLNPGQMLKLLKDYAEVYFHIKKASHHWWIHEKSWPVEMVYVLEDIKLLGFRQLYPLVLSIFFEFKDIKEKEKKSIANYLEILVAYIFRTTTIKEKISRGIHQSVTTRIIDENVLGNNKNKNLFDNDKIREKLSEEFNDEEDIILYKKLENHHTSANKTWKFVLEKIYWRNFQKRIEMREESNFFNKLRWRKAFQLEHIIPIRGKKDKNFVEYKDESIKYLIGNTTLLKRDDNLKVLNESWNKKKSWFLTLVNNCCLNWEKYVNYEKNPYVPNLLKVENHLSEKDIKYRTLFLINELKRYKIFEAKI